MVDADDGTTTISEMNVITSGSSTLRNCNTCFVASRTAQRLHRTRSAPSRCLSKSRPRTSSKALLQTMIEMQSSRIGFARYAEELNGGYADVTVSREMDRLFKMVESLKETRTEQRVH